jgi:transposase
MRPKLKEEGSPMGSYVGLDVHSKRSVLVIEAEDGRVVARGDIPTTPAGFRQLRQHYELAAETPVALETGTVAFYAARELARVGLRPVVIDAHEVRLKAHRPRQKSDRRDAFELCEGLRRGQYRAIVHVPPAPIGALRETLSRRRHFVAVRVAEVNAVKRLLRAAGLGHLSKSLGTEAAWAKLLAALAPEPVLRTHVAQHHALWRCAQQPIAALEETLAAQPPMIAQVAARLQTVPGVGPLTSLTAVAVFSDVRRFPSAKHAASYAGLVPSTDQSGDRDTHGHITKRGSAALRTMLCEAAHHAQRPTHPLHPYFARRCAQRGYKMAVVAVAHRLCRSLFALLRDGVAFDVAKLAGEEGPFRRTRVQRYRLKRAPVSRRA